GGLVLLLGYSLYSRACGRSLRPPAWACSGRSRRVSRSAISATATPSTTNTPGVSASGLFRGCTRQGRRYAWRVSTVWPSSVERVAEYLRAAGAEARLEELSGDTATAVEAASAAGC